MMLLYLLATVVAASGRGNVQSELKARNRADAVLSMPALGRSFALGDIYHSRLDELKPIGLWNATTLPGNCTSRFGAEPSAFVGSFKQDDLMQLLGMPESLRLSYRAGLFRATGAAAVLSRQRSTNLVAEAGVHFLRRKRVCRLFSDHLQNANYPNVLDKTRDIGTHTVSEIEFGHEAIIVFSWRARNLTELVGLQSRLDGMVRAMIARPHLNVNRSLGITFHLFGNYDVNYTSHTFQEGQLLYRRLLSMSTRKNEVPLHVQLTPFPALAEQKAAQTATVDLKTSKSIGRVIDTLTTLRAKLRDLQRSYISASVFDGLASQLSAMETLLSQFETVLQTNLDEILHKLRTDKCGEAKLNLILGQIDSGPLNAVRIDNWLNARWVEAEILTQIHQEFHSRNVSMGLQKFEVIKADISVRNVIAFEMKLYPQRDPFLEAIEKHLSAMNENSDFSKLLVPESRSKADWLTTGHYRLAVPEFLRIFDSLAAFDATRMVAYDKTFDEKTVNSSLGVHLFNESREVVEFPGLPNVTTFNATKLGAKIVAFWTLSEGDQQKVESIGIVAQKTIYFLPNNWTYFEVPNDECAEALDDCSVQIFLRTTFGNTRPLRPFISADMMTSFTNVSMTNGGRTDTYNSSSDFWTSIGDGDGGPNTATNVYSNHFGNVLVLAISLLVIGSTGTGECL